MLNPTNQSLLYSPGCQTLWVCSDLTRSSSWTLSCLHYFTWHLISRSFLTCPNPSYSRSALLTSSLCLFSSIQEGELFLYSFSLSPWPVLGFAEMQLSLLLWSRFGNPLSGMNWDTWNLNLQTSYLLSHTVQALREKIWLFRRVQGNNQSCGWLSWLNYRQPNCGIWIWSSPLQHQQWRYLNSSSQGLCLWLALS